MTQQKMLAPNVTIWALDKANAPADLLTLTDTDLNTLAVNISCAIVAGYTLNPTDPNFDTSKSICDSGNVDTPTTNQYEGNITFFRDANLADNTSVFNKAFQLFKFGGWEGYLIRRFGKLSSVVAAGDDPVQVFGFESDIPKSVDGADNAPPIQFTVKYIPSGEITEIFALTAGV